jgi:hypothetical protein
LLNYRNAKNKLNHFHENKRNKKMFKKTLLAVTLAALSAGVMAVDVDTSSTTFTYGSEGLNNGFIKNDFTAVQLNSVILTLGAAYSVGDIIKINLAGATFKTDETYSLATTNAPAISVGFLSATANQLVFRVTAADGTSAAEKLTLAAGSKIKLDSVAVGAKVTVSAAAETSTGIAIDVTGAKDSKVVGTVIQQHKFEVTTANKLDLNIDVADERKSLATAAFDTATVTYTHTLPTFGPSNFDVATATTGLKLTARGSFTGFEKGVTSATNLGVISLFGTDAVVAADLQSGAANVKLLVATTALPVLFTPDAAAATRVVLNAGAYTVDAAISDGNFTTTVTGLALGSLELNGASEVFGYVPVNFSGAVTSQFEIGNKGVVDGEITISGFDTAGNNYSAALPFKAEAGKLTKIGDDDIAKAFGLTMGTKLNLTITVNSPDDAITMSGYSNRGTTGRMSLSAN